MVIIGLVLALAGLVVTALRVGAYPVTTGDALAAVGAAIGLGRSATDSIDATTLSVIQEIRLPRVLLAVLVGGSLSTSGVLLQGMFRNPLAEPGIVGVSAGAAVGAVGGIVTGFAVGALGVAAAAFVGGLITTLLVYAVARSSGRTETVTLVLSGIAVNSIAGALIGLAMFVSDDAQLRSITFWNLGTLGAATWTAVSVVAPIATVGLLVAPRFARSLDLVSLGEDAAGHLGIDVKRMRLQLIVVVAALASAAVAVAGIISFVGLVVPHLARMVLGPRHRVLIPACALGGACLLVGADLVARTIAAPAEIPLGVLTGLIGGPFFFWLLLRARKADGGWA
ncbi:MAG: iron complex transport system permease protein [Myxococcota bacterium]